MFTSCNIMEKREKILVVTTGLFFFISCSFELIESVVGSNKWNPYMSLCVIEHDRQREWLAGNDRTKIYQSILKIFFFLLKTKNGCWVAEAIPEGEDISTNDLYRNAPRVPLSRPPPSIDNIWWVFSCQQAR